MAESLHIPIRLTPKAARSAVQGWGADADGGAVLKVTVTAVPEKGKANAALIALLAKTWGIPKSGIAILRGETDRNKLIGIAGLAEEKRRAILAGREGAA